MHSFLKKKNIGKWTGDDQYSIQLDWPQRGRVVHLQFGRSKRRYMTHLSFNWSVGREGESDTNFGYNSFLKIGLQGKGTQKLIYTWLKLDLTHVRQLGDVR
jgi:hypothetical protein